MNYQNKYLKYKNKYLNLKNHVGGFIKGNLKKEINTYDDFKTNIDTLMPLCYYDKSQSNFILINDQNYILIDKKTNEDYKVFKLTNTFDIIDNDKPCEMIKDNIIDPCIRGINKLIYGINLIQAYKYHNTDIFRIFLSKVWTSGYDFFNRLKDIIYKNLPDKETKVLTGQIVYQNQINIVLSLIFINKLDYLLLQINSVEINSDSINYFYNVEKTKESDEKNKITNKQEKNIITNFNDINTNILYDYIKYYDSHMVSELKTITTFDELCINLYMTLSIISNSDKISIKKGEPSVVNKFKFMEQQTDFNLLMSIIKEIYTYINENDHLVDQYNYSLYIDKYKSFLLSNKLKSTPHKSLLSFISYDRQYIKNKLILNLSSLIYLCYKTNIELGVWYKTSQYMILDYFYGMCKIKNECIPINQRQVLITILGELRNNEFDMLENNFYTLFKSPFKEIKQYKFPGGHTDCGETTILNVFNYFLIKENGEFNLTEIESWDEKLQIFYKKYKTMKSMINENIETLKTALAEVFNNRGDSVPYKYNDEGDINTSMDNIINTCAFVLGIKSTNFKDIFKKLKPLINIDDVSIDLYIIKYSDVFTLELTNGHSEFKLNRKIGDILDKGNNLEYHWICLNNYNLPDNYSLDHFKYYIKYGSPDFFKNFPKEKQTDEFCIEAVKEADKWRGCGHNIKHVNPDILQKHLIGMQIYLSAFVYGNLDIGDIPSEIITTEFCYDALKMDIIIIKKIPKKYQNQTMIDFIKEKMIIMIAEKKIPDKLYGTMLKNIKEELIDTDLCTISFDFDIFTFEYIPVKFQTENMIKTIISKVNTLKTDSDKYLLILLFKKINQDLLTQKICDDAVSIDVRFFKFIPIDKQSELMIENINILINQMTEKLINNTEVQQKITNFNKNLIDTNITLAQYQSNVREFIRNNKEYFLFLTDRDDLIKLRNSINSELLKKFGPYPNTKDIQISSYTT